MAKAKMAKRVYGGEKYTQNVSLKIMKRFMEEKQIADFFDRYEEVKFHRSFGIKAPDENDRRVARHFMKVQSVGLAAKELGISPNKVYAAVARVSAASLK